MEKVCLTQCCSGKNKTINMTLQYFKAYGNDIILIIVVKAIGSTHLESGFV